MLQTGPLRNRAAGADPKRKSGFRTPMLCFLVQQQTRLAAIGSSSLPFVASQREADAALQVRRGRSLEISAATNLPTCSTTLASAIE